MTTNWSDIIAATQTVLHDVRWQEQLAINPAQFYRAKSAYITMALPLLCRPPALLQYLQNGMVEPSYASAAWESTEESILTSTTVETGLTGFSLISVVRRSEDGTEATPYPQAVYDPASGSVTFPKQAAAGIQYEMDFYTDGVFPALTPSQKRLFALAAAIVWDEHFERDWLNLTPKIHDASFETVNEANYIDKSVKRLTENRERFADELRKYEQDCAAATVMPRAGLAQRLI